MVKKFTLLFTFLLSFIGLSQGQSHLARSGFRSHYTYIYQLNNLQAHSIHQSGPRVVRAHYFQTLVDSFAVGERLHKTLPQGHYLFVHSNGPELVYDLKTYSPLFIKVLPAKSALAVLVHDSLGNTITDARVQLNNRKAPYDPATQTYRLRHAPREGLLTVTRNGFTLMETLSREEENARSWSSHLTGAPPVRWLLYPFRSAYQSLRWRSPQGWVRSLFALFDADYRRSGSRRYRGYLVTNKPLYQPGDTVRYKAFVTGKNGKQEKGKALLLLSGAGMQAKELGTVKPYRNGGFEGWFVLQDSLNLKLDYPYTISLRKPGTSGPAYVSHVFRYEDYELRENQYHLALKSKEHASGQPNSLTLRGTNANGLSLLDAHVEVTVVTSKVSRSEEPVVFVPDTLWVHRQPLEARGETLIPIPEKVFPKASVDYAVTATFLTAGNERHTLTQNAGYRYAKGNLKLTLLQDSLLVQYLEGGREIPRQAELTAYNADFDDLLATLLQLPARVPLHAFAAGYDVTAGKLEAGLDLEEQEALVNLTASRANDSLYFAVQNPRRLPYWYFVYRGEKLVARGQGKEAGFLFQRPAKGKKPYFVALQYLWAGQMHQLQQDAPHRRHQLTIDLQAPQVVYPGQQTNMKVAVKNAAGKPVANVDLTAYAVTAKFQTPHIPALPSWDRYKKQKPYRRLEKEDSDVGGRQPLDWDYWGRRMGLDSMAYYNFRYPKSGLFTEYALARDSLTQVSPFVVDAGRVVPVHVVYLDEVPVYFSRTEVLPAYAFAADSGYHTLRLRTADKLITLDSIYLRHRHRLVVSADITAAGNPYARQAEKGTLSAAEQSFLYKHLLLVEHRYSDTAAYLQQGNRVHLLENTLGNLQANYYRRRARTTLLAGPFSPGWMQYVSLDNFTTNFRMEPGYQYHFGPHLLKMQEWKRPQGKIYLPTWDRRETKTELLYQQALTDKRIRESWQEAQYERFLGKIYADNAAGPGPKGTGRLGWDLEAALMQQVRLVLLHQAGLPDSLRVYPRESKILYHLQPASYVLTLAFTNGEVVSARVSVKANGQTQVYFTAADGKSPSRESQHLLQLVDQRVAQRKKLDAEKAQQERQVQQTARETNFTLTNGSDQFSHLVSGQITDGQNGESVPGVTVVLKGTRIGTLADVTGHYQLYVPADGVLTFSFVGYVTKEELVRNRNTIHVNLEEDVKMLQEVVVVGYGVQKKTVSLTAATAVLKGKVPGLAIRGVTTLKADYAPPLLIVDGIPYSGTLADLDPATILSTQTLKGNQATGIYGAAAASGVILVNTKNGGAQAPEMQHANAIRNNFSDYAFWQPRLRTDKQGEASFKAAFPDDVTRWNTYVLGMDNKKRSGIHSTSTNAFKAMMATLHLPRFLLEGDRASVVGKALNYLPEKATVTTRFEVGGAQVKTATRLLDRSLTDTLRLTAPARAADSLAVGYSLQRENGFADGERRYVAVYPKGADETAGRFLVLDSDTTFSLTFDPAKGPVRLRTQGNLLQVMLEEIDYLHRYEYWCSEQAASKLMSLLLEKKVRQQLGQPFGYDPMVKKLIRHLEKTQLQEGAWTWWQQGRAYDWITAHVVEALVMAKNAGYPVNYQQHQLTEYLVLQLGSKGAFDQLTALETLQHLGAKVDYAAYVKQLEKKRKSSLEEQLRLTRLRLRLQLPASLDTLQRHKKQTLLGSLYWGEEKHSLFNNSISTTLLAYEILRQAKGHERELARIRTFLLQERRAGHWRNTYESARVLATLLPDLLAGQAGKEGLPQQAVSFSGAVNFEASRHLTDTTFAATGPVVVKKQGRLPVYLTTYQTAWNPSPRQVTKDFIVRSIFKGSTGKADLQAGTPVEMVVEVEAKAAADYVMIEVPIPASCSYEAKAGYGPYEVHREYYRNKVSIFCDWLPKGRHTYTIRLLPRYRGTYTLNPARAALMYFPAFFGRNEMKQVQVK